MNEFDFAILVSFDAESQGKSNETKISLIEQIFAELLSVTLILHKYRRAFGRTITFFL